MAAAAYGHLAVVTKLAELGVDLNAATDVSNLAAAAAAAAAAAILFYSFFAYFSPAFYYRSTVLACSMTSMGARRSCWLLAKVILKS